MTLSWKALGQRLTAMLVALGTAGSAWDRATPAQMDSARAGSRGWL